MSELQATVEFSVELHKFYNVDLFQRGLYQVRTTLKVSPKLSVKVEVNLARNQKSECIYPPSIINGWGVSKTFQILYRNEEILLDNVIMFRAHLLVDSHKIEETLERADFNLSVELWFFEQAYTPESVFGQSCVSMRTLQLHFSPTKGLHYHLPVLFDYFHLAAVTMTIHATLVALHQPYINTPRSAKPLFGNSYRLHPRHPQSAVDTFLFGNINSTKCVSSGSRLTHARHVHQEVCSILLTTYETLQAHLHEYMKLLPAWQQLKLESNDYLKRLNNLSDFAKACHRNLAELRNNTEGQTTRTKHVDGEEDFISIANSDIAQLCAENILLWQQFLETFTCKDPLHQHLAKTHHQLRVKRFSEAFFVVDNPRQSAAGCYDANYQNYLAVSEMVRRSRYLATLPPLPVMCVELDGDLTTMPIIFEDQYQDMAEFARRRSGASRKSGSDPFLNLIGEKLGTRLVKEEDCSCGIVAILESRSQLLAGARAASAMQQTHGQRQIGMPMSLGLLGIEEKKRADKNIVTATLTIGPPKKSAEIVTDISTLPLKHNSHSGHNRALPTRHSKSLDQLKHAGVRSHAPLPSSTPVPPNYITRSASSTVPSSRMAHRKSLPARGTNGAATSPSTDSAESIPLVCKKMEQSLSVPYNLCEYPVISDCASQFSMSKRIKHSESTMSMPNTHDLADRFIDNIRVVVGNSSESMPNLIQTPSDSPKHYGLFTKTKRTEKDLLALYEIGDSTIVEEMGDEPYNVLPDRKSPKLGEASLSSPLSSSLSDDITSEQSGWVSNSSRHSSGSRSSSGALSPDLAAFCRKELPDYSTLRMQQNTGRFPLEPVFDGNSLLEKLEKLAVEAAPLVQSQVYDDLRVPPPQQFSDVPLPPEPFRDPPQPPAPDSQDSVDNLLYHVYEGVKEMNKRETELKKKPKNLKTSLENIVYDLVRESRKHKSRRKQGKERKSKVTSDEGFDEMEVRYCDSDTSTVTVDSFNLGDNVKDKFKVKNPFEGYLFKEDIETLKKTLELHKDKRRDDDFKAERMQGLEQMNGQKDGRKDDREKECDCHEKEDRARQKSLQDETLIFIKAKEEFKRQVNFSGMIYSDFPTLASTLPYFHISDEYRIFSPEGLHLIVCVHGLDGNSADLRLVKTYLELGLPGANLEFLMSERNQGDTFSDFDTMTDKLVAEILYHVETCGVTPSKISFIGHSLGNIIVRSAITRPQMKHLLSRFYTFLSLSGPHLGTLYNNSGLVNMGMWFMQKWKKSGSLLQLSLRDASDVRHSFLYRLSQKSNLQHFRHVLLCGSSQDRYVPMHSARIELCKAAIKDTTVQGAVYREMIHNIMYPVINSADTTLVRYDIHHALPNTANSLIGRAAHIAVLDSELFIEKFLVVTGLKYFR